MELPPVAVRTAYFFAQQLPARSLADMRERVREIDWETEAQREYAVSRYDLALRIAQQPLEGPELPAGVGY